MNAFLVLWILSQPAPTTGSLNLNQQPIESRQGGVRIATTRQYAVNCGTNMTCSVSGGQLTLSSSGGTGAPSNATYITQTADATLTNEQPLSANATGLMISTNGTGVVTTYAGATCGANQFATQTNASGALTCAQPSFANLSGTATTAQLPTIPVTKGGTNLTTIAANQVWTGTAADTVVAKTVPDCDDSAGQHLNFDNTTQTWSCGTTGSGGYATIQDEGTPLTQRTTLNFIGASIACVDDTTRTNCTISGGGGGISYAEAVAATLGGF